MAAPKRQPIPVVREAECPFLAVEAELFAHFANQAPLVDAINEGMAATTPQALTAKADAQRAEDAARVERPRPTDGGVIEIVYGQSKQWLVTLEDDGISGFHWFASRYGVLWAKGWARTRSQRTAELVAKRSSAEVFESALQAGEVSL